ncbi:MAG: class I SAM-dependent methyltransferase [Bdellovibrionota bacterium]
MREFSFPYETKIEEFELGTRRLRIESLKSLDETIDAHFAEFEKTGNLDLFEDLCPYFGNPWPAGRALAAVADERAGDWRGLEILELGCGLALPSLVLAQAGLSVRVMDVHPDVPAFLERNLAHNSLAGVDCVTADWTYGVGGAEPDIILGSDILYDAKIPEALLGYLKKSTRWRELLIADPDRPHLARFLEGVKALGWTLEEDGLMGVRIFRISRD